jgi:hypothetical protein
MATTNESVRDLESAIRDRVNQAKLGSRLRKDKQAWNEIVSSLDVIGDTELALGAYLSSYPSEIDDGMRYLLTYGVLQALYLQQDAVIHLSAALGGRSKKEILSDGRLRTARDIRNQAVGHPTRKDRPKPITTHQISRISLGQHGFDMLTADEHGEHRMESVSVVKLIREQREAMTETLKALDDKLDHDDQTSRKQFQDERLADLFPDSLGYTFEKMWEATQGKPERAVLGPWGLQTIKDVMAKFVEALERRGLDRDAYPGIKDWFASVAHPLAELERFFDPSGGSTLHPQTAAIVVDHLRRMIEELQEMAASIDEDWQPRDP